MTAFCLFLLASALHQAKAFGETAPNSCTLHLPFCNASLSIAQRSADLVAHLTNDDKITQLSTYSFTKENGGFTPGVPSLGIPAFSYHTEGLHGVRTSSVVGLPVTVYPQVTAMAATGNLSRVREMAKVMGTELRAINNIAKSRNDSVFSKGGGLSIYGPTINIIRDPRWGRAQESVSECPFLNGAYAVEFVRGIQGDHDKYLQAAATCKHLVAYSVESGRQTPKSNVNVSRRDLAETYLPAFRACVVGAQAAQAMCAYNGINGVPACLHADLQNGVLRERWGWNGAIVSDCDSIKDAAGYDGVGGAEQATALGLKAGCDLDCGSTYSDQAAAAIASGQLEWRTVDAALERIFALRFALGEFDDAKAVPYTSLGRDDILTTSARASALGAARESIVLLQNRARALPLKRNSALRIAVIGPLANDTSVLCGAKSDYFAPSITTPLQGLAASPHVSSVSYAAGLVNVKDANTTSASWGKAVRAAAVAEATVIVVGIDASVEAETRDREDVSLPGAQLQLIQAVMNASKPTAPVVIVLVNGAALGVDWIADHADTVIEAFEGGMYAGEALAGVIFGDVSPSGMMPFTTYREEDVKRLQMADFAMRPHGTAPGRTYRFFSGEPLWSFGHGESYAEFMWEWTERFPSNVTTAQLAIGGLKAKVRVSVPPSSPSAGATTVQLYIIRDTRDAPLRQLVALMKTPVLPPGAESVVTLSIPKPSMFCAFCAVDEDGSSWLRAGGFTMVVGNHRELEHELQATGPDVRVEEGLPPNEMP